MFAGSPPSIEIKLEFCDLCNPGCMGDWIACVSASHGGRVKVAICRECVKLIAAKFAEFDVKHAGG